MDIDIELYRGADKEYFGDYPLDRVLRRAAVLHFGDLARRGQLHLVLEKPSDPEPYAGPPEIYNAAKLGHCTLQLIQDRDLWRKLGVNAYETVRQHFLFPTLILGYLKALQGALARTEALAPPESVPLTRSDTSKELHD